MEISHERDRLARNLGEVVDRFLTVQFTSAGGPSVYLDRPTVESLYQAARQAAGEPLSYGAARRLADRVGPGDVVVVITGFIVPPYMRLEADGPVGTAALARALALGLGAQPVVVTEAENVKAVESVIRASGLPLARDLDEFRRVPQKTIVLPFTTDPLEAPSEAEALLDALAPAAVVAIEKPGRNREGRYHNGMGIDVTDLCAKADELVEAARRKGVLTIGFADGGNEIGMGNIAPAISPLIPGGDTVCSATEVDYLVVASSSSWGAYGAETCLAALLGRPEVLHDEEAEGRILQACALAGVVDPFSGLAEGWLDGTPAPVSQAIVRILQHLLRTRLDDWALARFRAWGRKREFHEELIRLHRERAGRTPGSSPEA